MKGVGMVSTADDADQIFSRAVNALAAGETTSALALLERALKQKDNPSWHSYLGYCIAKERGQVKRGKELCLEAVERDPENPVHYLNLARVQLITGQKGAALEMLRRGMSFGGTPETLALLERLGNRKPPVLSFLPRQSPVNKWLGKVLSLLRLR